MNRIHYLLFLISVFIVLSCNKYIMTFNSEKTQSAIWEKDQQYNLIFESTPSAGYKWILLPTYDSTKVKCVNKQLTKEKKDLNLLGGKVQETWTFDALSKAKVDLVFYYKRSWEEKAIDSILYKIKVK